MKARTPTITNITACKTINYVKKVTVTVKFVTYTPWNLAPC